MSKPQRAEIGGNCHGARVVVEKERERRRTSLKTKSRVADIDFDYIINDIHQAWQI